MALPPIRLHAGPSERKDQPDKKYRPVLPTNLRDDEVVPYMLGNVRGGTGPTDRGAITNQYHSDKGDPAEWEEIISWYALIAREFFSGISMGQFTVPGKDEVTRGKAKPPLRPHLISPVNLTRDALVKISECDSLQVGYRNTQLTADRGKAIISPLHWAWLNLT